MFNLTRIIITFIITICLLSLSGKDVLCQPECFCTLRFSLPDYSAMFVFIYDTGMLYLSVLSMYAIFLIDDSNGLTLSRMKVH